MRNRELVSLTVIFLSLIAFWIVKNSLRAGGETFATGAALLPDLAVSVILGLSCLNLLRSVLGRQKSAATGADLTEDDVPVAGPQIRALLFVCGSMVIFSIGFPVIGYLPMSVLLLIGLMVAAGGRHKTGIILISGITVAVLYLGIRYGLGFHVQILPDFLMSGGL